MLAQLSVRYPEVWKTQTESTNKSPDKSLCHFLTKGSQGAHAEFWRQVLIIIRHIPIQILSAQSDKPTVKDKQEVNTQILEAIHEGLLRKEESRLSQVEAWNTYLETVIILTRISGSSDAKFQLLSSLVAPIVEEYLRPDEKQRRWNIPGSSPAKVAAKAVEVISKGSADAFSELWNRLSNMLMQDLQTSLPEQSRDYAKSQGDIGTKVAKWYNLQALALKANDTSTLLPIFASTTKQELKIATNILVARNGKPFSAANAIAIALQSVPQITVQEYEVREFVISFLQRHLVNLALSPSLPYLIAVADELRSVGAPIQAACSDAVNTVVSADTSNTKSQALKTLLASPWLGESAVSSALGIALRQEVEQTLRERKGGWDYIEVAIANPAIPPVLAASILSIMTKSLSIEEQLAAGLRGLDITTKRNTIAIRDYSESSDGSTLLSRLLQLSDSPDDQISSTAQTLYKSIEEILARNSDSEARSAPMILVIRDALIRSGPDSVRYVLKLMSDPRLYLLTFHDTVLKRWSSKQ